MPLKLKHWCTITTKLLVDGGFKYVAILNKCSDRLTRT